jgi:hypothetical protein
MYRADRRQKKRGIIIKFIFLVIPFLLIIGVAIWFILFRTNSSSSSFTKSGVEIAQVQPSTKVIKTDLFSIQLPTTWELLGKKNPFTNQVYYEFQNKLKNYDNRWIRVYVDVFPKDYAIKKLLPISVIDNKIIPGQMSDDCTNFTGAPLTTAGRSSVQTWDAKWQNIAFTCDMASIDNNVGTASETEGYGVTLNSQNGVKHKYFFVYIDRNVRPEYTTFNEALKSFTTL